VVLVIFGAWEAMSRSGLFDGEVVPSLLKIGASLGKLLVDPVFYRNLQVMTLETMALAIGAGAGITTGIVLGANRFSMRAFEPYVYYLSRPHRASSLPATIMWFGVGPALKIALGALSAFFAIALSTAAGMRQIDPILIASAVRSAPISGRWR
jgi:ABC-type nitrate/sulfonate/bicarbonate transport system permease component